MPGAPGVGAGELPPLTWGTMGRFFGVPLIIITTIVGGAVMVVFLFGGPSAPRERSIEELLQVLKSNNGARSAGVLLPREKELWQAALELSERFKKKEVELTHEQIQDAANQLSEMVREDFTHIDTITAFDTGVLDAQREARSRRFEFLMRALARTGVSIAVPPLVEIIKGGREPFVGIAIQQLGELHGLPEARSACGMVLKAMNSSQRPETKVVSCVVLSLLAEKGDAAVIEALADARVKHDGEVAWNAALAMARLGSASGKGTLLDMLDRGYWEKGERYEKVDASGMVLRYPMPAGRTDALMSAAIDAVSNLQDPELWGAIDRLQSDRSLVVRGRAKAAMERRSGL